MTDAVDRLSRIEHQRMRGWQMELNGIADKIAEVDRRQKEIVQELSQARQDATDDPRFGQDLDRFERAAQGEYERLNTEQSRLQERYRQVEDHVYAAFGDMKTYETIAERRRDRARREAERQEANERDDLATVRRFRRNREKVHRS